MLFNFKGDFSLEIPGRIKLFFRIFYKKKNTRGKMTKSFLRGHSIIYQNGEWLYQDTKSPTVSNPRPCGHCGKPNTIEGHDACLGILPGVMNACCGHGVNDNAYVQISPDHLINGEEAVMKIAELQSIKLQN